MSSSEAVSSGSQSNGAGVESAGVESVGTSRRDVVRGFGVTLLATGLAACESGGFKPMYGSLGTGPRLAEKLERVQIAPIPGRTGQRLRNELIFTTTRGGRAATPAYRLEVAIKESSSSSLVLRDGGSAAQIVVVDAQFQLIRLSDKKVLVTGTSHGRANFERFFNVFSNLRAADEAQERAAKVVANDVTVRISAVLSAEA